MPGTSARIGLRVACEDAGKHKHAYRLGCIQDHTEIMTGENHAAIEVAESLKSQAEADPTESGNTVTIEELVDNGNGTSTWKAYSP
jgi:hypothetical protein